MNIDLTRQDVYRILKEKFGEATFRVLYVESDKSLVKKRDERIGDLVIPPDDKFSAVLHFDDSN